METVTFYHSHRRGLPGIAIQKEIKVRTGHFRQSIGVQSPQLFGSQRRRGENPGDSFKSLSSDV